MIHFKLRYAINGLLPLIIGQFIGMNIPCMMAVTKQDVDVRRPTHSVNGSIEQAVVLFCISGDIPQTICFTSNDLAQLPRTTLTVSDRNNTRITYEGVLLREVLKRAGVPQGEQLRGSNLARYLVVEAVDGYAVVFSLPEFDPGFGNRVVLLADRRDGHALATDEAPLRLVIPEDRRHARWVRRLTRIRVMQAAERR